MSYVLKAHRCLDDFLVSFDLILDRFEEDVKFVMTSKIFNQFSNEKSSGILSTALAVINEVCMSTLFEKFKSIRIIKNPVARCMQTMMACTTGNEILIEIVKELI